jgi:hypothetical protein
MQIMTVRGIPLFQQRDLKIPSADTISDGKLKWPEETCLGCSCIVHRDGSGAAVCGV